MWLVLPPQDLLEAFSVLPSSVWAYAARWRESPLLCDLRLLELQISAERLTHLKHDSGDKREDISAEKRTMEYAYTTLQDFHYGIF